MSFLKKLRTGGKYNCFFFWNKENTIARDEISNLENNTTLVPKKRRREEYHSTHPFSSSKLGFYNPTEFFFCLKA